MNDVQDLENIIVQLVKWHKSRVKNCQLILNNEEADINFNGSDKTLPSNSVEAKWLRIGVGIALEQFINFPAKISQCDDTEEDDDE